MPDPYTVLDADSGGLYGPFDRLTEAQACAQAFPRYEIVNDEGNVVDWTTERPRPLPIAPPKE